MTRQEHLYMRTEAVRDHCVSKAKECRADALISAIQALALAVASFIEPSIILAVLIGLTTISFFGLRLMASKWMRRAQSYDAIMTKIGQPDISD